MQEFPNLDVGQMSEQSILAGRDQAIAQMRWMRAYSLQLIESIPHELWYQAVPGLPSHVAWQVGHMAVAQYGLMLFRQRGRVESDMELMPSWLRKNFGRGSQPASANEAKNPTPAVLLEHFHAIHRESCQVAATLGFATLIEPIDMPYAAYPVKLGALVFCPMHEAIHAGQIGLLRRGLGLEPVR